VGSVVIERQTSPMAQPGTWLGCLLARKPGMPVRVALANSERQRATDGVDGPRLAASRCAGMGLRSNPLIVSHGVV
jgi:hypothetical protein